ncbi:plasmid pRiA4b ORF-3 family protein, partial [Rhodococcus gannanensis]
MGAFEPGRRLRVVPTDPDELRAFVEGIDSASPFPNGGAVAYRIRVTLDGVMPPVWRSVTVRSTSRLDELHDVLQTVMGWNDSHLHQWRRPAPENPGVVDRFATRSCIEDGFADGARCEDMTRLDDVLTIPGDVMVYEYDFGDGWEHTILLEGIDSDESPEDALCLAGERACPPEDCGGVPGYARLLAVLADREHSDHVSLSVWSGGFDPEAFSVDDVNALLAARDAMDLYPPVTGSRIEQVLARIPYQAAPHVHALMTRAHLQVRFDQSIDDVMDGALTHLRWLLRRIGDDGIALTQSGYVPPVHVKAARDELDWGDRRVGNSDRETDNPHFERLRDSARALGLTRKYRGQLVLTKRGSTALARDQELWDEVRTGLPLGRERIELEAGHLVLLTVAAGASWSERRRAMVEGLAALGWRNPDGSALNAFDASWVAAATEDFLSTIGALGPFDGVPPDWARGFAQIVLST